MSHPSVNRSPSMVALWEPSLGRLEMGGRPFIVEQFQIGSPDIRENVKNRALSDGVFDDTLYHGASAITVSTRLATAGRVRCDPTPNDPHFSELRDRLVSYCHPRLRPRLFWRYPGDDVGRWATVRGVSWPFVVDGPKYPTLAVQFKNPLGQMSHGDPQAPPNTATANPGAALPGRTYNLIFNRDYPAAAVADGSAAIRNEGNVPAGWEMEVHGPFDAGALVVLRGKLIEMNQALALNEYVTFRTLNKTILKNGDLSYYPHTNFGEWDWEDLMLPPGDSFLSIAATSGGAPSGYATIEWYHTSI